MSHWYCRVLWNGARLLEMTAPLDVVMPAMGAVLAPIKPHPSDRIEIELRPL